MSDRVPEFVPVVEALLFAADEPLPTRRLVELLPELEATEVTAALDALNEQLEQADRGLRLEEVGGGWRFTTRSDHAPFLERLVKGKRVKRLSHAALETLAVVLYRQPVTKAEIEAIRGVSVDGPLRTLLDRDLVKVSGRAAGPGRPLLYASTRELLRYLGLRDLRDLPQLDELEGVLATSEESDPAQLELGQDPDIPPVVRAADDLKPGDEHETQMEDGGEAPRPESSGGDPFESLPGDGGCGLETQE